MSCKSEEPFFAKTVVADFRDEIDPRMSPNLPDKMLFRGIPPPLLLQWAFHGRGRYIPPDAFAMVRRHVASICGRSFDVISILGKIVFGPNSYIGIKMIFFQNPSFKIDLGQTTPPKMTAMTIG